MTICPQPKSGEPFLPLLPGTYLDGPTLLKASPSRQSGRIFHGNARACPIGRKLTSLSKPCLSLPTFTQLDELVISSTVNTRRGPSIAGRKPQQNTTRPNRFLFRTQGLLDQNPNTESVAIRITFIQCRN